MDRTSRHGNQLKGPRLFTCVCVCARKHSARLIAASAAHPRLPSTTAAFLLSGRVVNFFQGDCCFLSVFVRGLFTESKWIQLRFSLHPATTIDVARHLTLGKRTLTLSLSMCVPYTLHTPLVCLPSEKGGKTRQESVCALLREFTAGLFAAKSNMESLTSGESTHFCLSQASLRFCL